MGEKPVMTELDVSAIQDADVEYMSASECELGPDAGRITWDNSLRFAEAHPLATEENAEDIRSHFYEYGAWDRAEIDAWSDTELSAMVWQEAAADYRCFLEHCEGSLRKYRRECEVGSIAGRLFISVKRNGKRTISIYLGM